MSRIFLSHSSRDSRQAVALKQWMVQRDASLADEIFLDLDPRGGILPGQRWKDALRQAATRCEAVICLLSPNWEASAECKTEYRTAETLNKPIFPVRLGPSEGTEITREWQFVDLFGDGPKTEIDVDVAGGPVAFLSEGLDRLWRGIGAAGIGTESFEWPPTNDPHRAPYRGWAPLEQVDAAVFFGRDAQIIRGLDALRGMRKSGVETLFVIPGPSGAGKSSFLRAGLLPRLHRDDRNFLPLEIVRPERNVLTGIHGLAQAIRSTRTRLGLKQPLLGEIKRACLDDAARVYELLLEAQQAARSRLLDVSESFPLPTLVLPVDQAEELFSADAGPEGSRFLDLIGQHADTDSADRLSLIIALTIRTDRSEALQTAPQLTNAESVAFHDLKPLPRTQFMEVITGPARRATEGASPLRIEAALVEQLLADSEGADTLPLLSLTLARLYEEYGSDGDLTLAEYEEMGRMQNVVQTEIDSLLSSDDAQRREELKLLRAAFIPWLATIGANDQAVRRVASWRDLPPEAHPLLDRFVAKRLLVRSGEAVEVALESLFRQWGELNGWLEDERDNLKRAEALERSAADWHANNLNPAWLIGGTRLEDAETLARTPGFRKRLSAIDDYIAASRDAENKRLEAEEYHRQAELQAAKERAQAAHERQATAEAHAAILRKRSRVLGFVLVATAVLAIAALVGAIGFATANGQAQKRFREATAQRLISQSQQILDGSGSGSDAQAFQQLLAAWSLIKTDADEALHQAVVEKSDTIKILETPSPVTSVAINPNGDRIAAGSNDSKVRVWDTNTGKQVHELVVGTRFPAWSVAFSPDGTRIATGSGQRDLQLWDANTGNKIGQPMRHDEAVKTVAFSRDSRRIATGSDDGSVRVWETANQTQIRTLPGHGKAIVRSVAFSPNNDMFASGGDDGFVRLWDITRGQQVAEMQTNKPAVLSVAFSRLGDRVVAGLLDGTIDILDSRNLQPLATFAAHSNTVNSVAFSPDDNHIVTGGQDNTVRVWDSTSHQQIGDPLTGHDGEVVGVAYSRDGTRIVSGSADGTARVWDPRYGLPIPTGQGGIRAAAFSPSGQQIASGGRDGTVKLWDVKTAAALAPPYGDRSEANSRAVNGLAFNRDGSQIVTASNDGVVRLWNLQTHQSDVLPNYDPPGLAPPLPASLAGDPRAVKSVAFSANRDRIVSGANDGAVRVWDAHSLQPIATMRADYPVWSVAFDPDGRHVATGSGGYDNSVQVWSIETRTAGEPMVGHNGFSVHSVSFSRDGQRVVVGSHDGTTRVWDIGTRQVTELRGGQNAVLSVAYSSTDRWIVTGDNGGTMRLFNGDNYERVGVPMEGHHDWVTTVSFNGDDSRILSGSLDGNLRLWPPPTDFASVLCSKLASNMSPEQWSAWVSPEIEYEKACPDLP